METESPESVRRRAPLLVLLLALVTIVGVFGMAYAHIIAKPTAERRIPIHQVLEGQRIEMFAHPDPDADSRPIHERQRFSVSKQTLGDEWVRVTVWEDWGGWVRRSDLKTRSVRIRGGIDR